MTGSNQYGLDQSVLGSDSMNPPTTIDPNYKIVPTEPDPTDSDRRKIITPDTLKDMVKNGKMTNATLADFLESSYKTTEDARSKMALRGYELDETLSGDNVRVFVKYAKVDVDNADGGTEKTNLLVSGTGTNMRVDPTGHPIILDTTLIDRGTEWNEGVPKTISDLLTDLLVVAGVNKINPREISEALTASHAEEKYGPINAVGHSLAGKLISDNTNISGTKYIFNDGTSYDSLLFKNGANSAEFRTIHDPASFLGTFNPGDTVIGIAHGAQNGVHDAKNFTDYLRTLPPNTTPPYKK